MKKSRMVVVFMVLLSMVFAVQGVFGGGNKDAAGKSNYKFAWYAPAPHPTFDANLEGVKRFVTETGIEVKTQLGPSWEQAAETENVQALAAMGYKPMAICPADGSSANALFQELKDHGIPVINYCIPVTDTDSAAEIFIGTDIADATRVGIEALIKEMGGKGRILNVLEMLNDSNTVVRKRTIEEVVAKYAPDVQIIQEIADMSTVEEATKKVTDALSANIDRIDGIIATGNTCTTAIANALSDYYDRGNTRKIAAIGIDYDDVVLKAIRDGTLSGTVAQNPQGQSYIACHIMKMMTDGWKKRAGVFYINAGAGLVTKANVDTFMNDINKITDGIKADLETKYFQKN
jgi:ribose transport system substrate-binding protein